MVNLACAGVEAQAALLRLWPRPHFLSPAAQSGVGRHARLRAANPDRGGPRHPHHAGISRLQLNPIQLRPPQDEMRCFHRVWGCCMAPRFHTARSFSATEIYPSLSIRSTPPSDAL
jgi:hypothetical protein